MFSGSNLIRRELDSDRDGADDVRGPRLGKHVVRRAMLPALVIGCVFAMGSGDAYAAYPSVAVEAPTAVGETSATLMGTVNPHGTDTKYHFELFGNEPGGGPCTADFG